MPTTNKIKYESGIIGRWSRTRIFALPPNAERSIVGLLENTTPHRAHHECVQCVGCHVYKYTSYLTKEMAGQRPLPLGDGGIHSIDDG